MLPDFQERFTDGFFLPVGYIGCFIFHDLNGVFFLKVLNKGGGVIFFDDQVYYF
jgi:hypothetical protein